MIKSGSLAEIHSTRRYNTPGGGLIRPALSLPAKKRFDGVWLYDGSEPIEREQGKVVLVLEPFVRDGLSLCLVDCQVFLIRYDDLEEIST